MGFGHGFSPEDACDEGGGEGVASADGVGHLHFRSGLEGYVSGSEDIAAVDAAGEDEHPEIVLTEQNPALVLKIYSGVAEHTADRDELLVVDLEDIAALHGVAEDVLVVESLPEVDVEDHEGAVIGGHCVKEAVYCVAGHDVPLSERAEAHGLCLLREGFETGGVGDVVPGDVFLDFILRDTGGVNLDLDCTGRIGYGGDEVVEPLGGEVLDDFGTEGILPDGAHDAGG